MSPVVPHFELREEDSASGTHVINVRGEIHVQTAPRFSQRLSEAIDSGNTAIVLDLSAVEFIDSTGLSVLLSGLRRVTQQQGRLALVCANPTVLRLFQITSLDETFDIFPERAAAFAHVQAQPAEGSSAGAP
jgi:anti-sigma B factor antagonist